MNRLLYLIYRIIRYGYFSIFRAVFATYYLFVYFLSERPKARRQTGLRETSGQAQQTGFWCIFAISQRRQVSKNLIAALNCFRDLGYDVILINNGGLSPELVTAYLPYCHSVVERPHGGRDFGGYQWGTEFLRRLGGDRQIVQVVYCNDSNFIRPSTFAQLLGRIKQMTDDYIGITEVFQFYYHVQSWFFVISGRVFVSPMFQQFWQEYVPLSSRRHSINRGEAGIAKHLLQHNVYPCLLYTHSTIVDLVCDGPLEEVLERISSYFNPSEYKGLAATMQNDMALQLAGQANVLAMLKRGVMEKVTLSNTVHVTNLLLLKCSGFPFLKKDLVYRALYFFPQVENSLSHWIGEDAEQLPEILGHFRARGSLRWQHSPAAILARMGLI